MARQAKFWHDRYVIEQPSPSLSLSSQDIATHTRIAPSQREVSFKKFVDRVNKCPKVTICMV